MVIVAPNLPYNDFHLGWVAKEMEILGIPKIRCIWSDEYRVWFAAEGSHRIAASYRKGITPVIIDITGQGATVQREERDWVMTADELEGWLVSDVFNAPWYVFNG